MDFSSSFHLGHFHVGLAVELLVINTEVVNLHEDENETLEGLWISPANLKPVKCVNANAVNHPTAKKRFLELQFLSQTFLHKIFRNVTTHQESMESENAHAP